MRDLNVTPHVAQKMLGSAIDAASRQRDSQSFRRRVEEGFGWLKTVGPMRKRTCE